MKVTVIRKSYVTLLELIISLALTAVLLSTLTYFYHEVSYLNAETDREQNETFQKLYVENRLLNIFSKTVSSTDKSHNFHFFTGSDIGGLFKQGSPNVLFTFDNCVQLDKQMSYHVIGRLFLDPNDNLTLVKWPAPKRWKENEDPPMTKEVILENVEDMTLSYFIPPEKENTTQTLEIPTELRGQWTDDWKKEYHQLPAIVKVVLDHKDRNGKTETLTYLIPLPHTITPIIYDE